MVAVLSALAGRFITLISRHLWPTVLPFEKPIAYYACALILMAFTAMMLSAFTTVSATAVMFLLFYFCNASLVGQASH
jgi:uncharacterized membrane protein YhhN